MNYGPIGKILFPALLVSLPALLLAVACGPASPAVQVEPSPECTAERWDPDRYGCVKPTEPPLNTRVPTPTTPLEVSLARVEEGVPATPVPPLADRIDEAVASDRYDAIARVRVLSHDQVSIIPYEQIFVAGWIRSSLEVVETLRGELPGEAEIALPSGMPNAALDVGGYYVVFLFKGILDASVTQHEGDFRRIRLGADELTAFGGEASIYLGDLVWAVDGATVYRVPVDHLTAAAASALTDLAVAKAEGESMTLADLEAVLRPSDE